MKLWSRFHKQESWLIWEAKLEVRRLLLSGKNNQCWFMLFSNRDLIFIPCRIYHFSYSHDAWSAQNFGYPWSKSCSYLKGSFILTQVQAGINLNKKSMWAGALSKWDASIPFFWIPVKMCISWCQTLALQDIIFSRILVHFWGKDVSLMYFYHPGKISLDEYKNT